MIKIIEYNECTMIYQNCKWNRAFNLIFLKDENEEQHYIIRVKGKCEQFTLIIKTLNEKIPINYIYLSHGGSDGFFMDFHFLLKEILKFKMDGRNLIDEIKEIININYIKIHP